MAISISPEILMQAYARGAFPMAVAAGDIRWFSPDPRGILPLDTFHIPHGTRKILADPEWEVRIDTAFEDVMQGCADRSETWIDPSIHRLYNEIHRIGDAHSVEVWRAGQLVGGLYGVRMGAAFFGESMFHRVGGASKVALVALRNLLISGGFELLDIQWTTPHLEQFGAIEIPRSDYLNRLGVAIGREALFPMSGHWRKM